MTGVTPSWQQDSVRIFTPISDGTFIYLWLGSGVTACYDLDGNRKWIRSDVLPMVEHGFSSSPILVDGKIIVFMRDLFAFDAKTGKQIWRVQVVAHEGANPGGYFHGMVATARAGELHLDRTVWAWRRAAMPAQQPGGGDHCME